jgi:flavodoxin I
MSMNILILFATYSGGTRKAAEIIDEVLALKHSVTTIELDGSNLPNDVSSYDAIIFGTPTWMDDSGQQGRPHLHMIDLIENRKQNLAGKKCAVFVLGDNYYGMFAHSAVWMSEYVQSQGGELITEPLRINKMQFDEENNSEKVEKWAKELEAKLN